MVNLYGSESCGGHQSISGFVIFSNIAVTKYNSDCSIREYKLKK